MSASCHASERRRRANGGVARLGLAPRCLAPGSTNTVRCARAAAAPCERRTDVRGRADNSEVSGRAGKNNPLLCVGYTAGRGPAARVPTYACACVSNGAELNLKQYARRRRIPGFPLFIPPPPPHAR